MSHQLNDYVPVRNGKLVVGLSPVRPYAQNKRPRVDYPYGIPYLGKSGYYGRIKTENAKSTRLCDSGAIVSDNFFVPIDPELPARVECEGGDTETDAKWHEHYEWDPSAQSWAVTSLSMVREWELNQLAIQGERK